MLIIKRRAYARAGLLGNPSDGYNGRTISAIVRNYFAEVILYEWEDVEIVLSQNDKSRFSSIQDLAEDVVQHGYYGGIRLVKATIKRFVNYCNERNIPLHDRNFSIRYESNIPRQVGMAGSSAIIVATLRALCAYYDVTIPPNVGASLVLSVESGELGIAAGLQDRVIQMYEGVVYMDFAVDRMHEVDNFVCGDYEPLPLEGLPRLYVAFAHQAGQPTEIFHNDLRSRYHRGEAEVVEAMYKFANYAAEGREAIRNGDTAEFSRLVDANFDLRQSLCQLPPQHVNMVRTARAAGASAKFAGSGGAITGVYPNEAAYIRLRKDLMAAGCVVLKPKIEACGC